MANTDPPVFLKLQHGANYTDLRSGTRWTTSSPIQPVTKERAMELLRETLPLYQGETSRTVRRFAAVPAPPPAERKGPPPPPPVDEAVERTEDELLAEIAAAGAASPAAESTEGERSGPPEKVEGPGGQRQRQRLPKGPEGSGGPTGGPSSPA